MDWKKLLKRFLTVLLLILLGVEACMELRYPRDEISVTSKNTEKILRRTPEVSITEKDRALMAELLEVPSVQELVWSGETGDARAWEDPEVLAAAEKHLSGEAAGVLNVSVLFHENGYEVFTGWREEKGLFYLQTKPEEDGDSLYKFYSPKRGTSYENWDNERAQKSEVHRRWLAWLRDGLWKDEE